MLSSVHEPSSVSGCPVRLLPTSLTRGAPAASPKVESGFVHQASSQGAITPSPVQCKEMRHAYLQRCPAANLENGQELFRQARATRVLSLPGVLQEISASLQEELPLQCAAARILTLCDL